MHKGVAGLGLGIVAALFTTGRGVAQDAPGDARLTVRPHKMATATQTAQAGEFPLDSLPHYMVTVPPQCVGTRRCPLVIHLPWSEYGQKNITDLWRPVAAKYGMIVLAANRDPTSEASGHVAFTDLPNRGNLDAALKQVLRKFAIDPDKIAIIGRRGSGTDVVRLAPYNTDVFSRIVMAAGDVPTDLVHQKNTTVEFLLDIPYWQSQGYFKLAQELRHDGHPVKMVLTLRDRNEPQAEEAELQAHWLQESWATPNPAARPAPAVVAEPLPLLTTDAISQMTAFWTSFQKEPDSIRMTARQAHLREVVAPIAQERPATWIVDMPALAARYPSVAADLKKAGLTAQQHDAYRVALISALHAKVLRDAAEGDEAITRAVDANSVLGKNLMFIEAHEDELGALRDTHIWLTP